MSEHVKEVWGSGEKIGYCMCTGDQVAMILVE